MIKVLVKIGAMPFTSAPEEAELLSTTPQGEAFVRLANGVERWVPAHWWVTSEEAATEPIGESPIVAHCPFCHSTEVADADYRQVGLRVCLDCEKTWNVSRR